MSLHAKLHAGGSPNGGPPLKTPPPQGTHTDRLRPQLTTSEIVKCGQHGALEPRWHSYDSKDQKRAEELLGQVGLPGYADRTLSTLSSGERQRTLLARSLMSYPSMLILDEPTAGLDIAGRKSLVAALDHIARSDGPSWVMVTHQVEDIPPSTTRCLLLKPSGLAVSGPIEEMLTSENLTSIFGLNLMLQNVGQR